MERALTLPGEETGMIGKVRPPRLTVDLGALAENWRTLDERAGSAEAAAVVKADAYGLGAARVVPALIEAGARTFFVARVEEALELADLFEADAARGGAGAACRVFVLEGAQRGADLMAKRGILPVLNQAADLKLWANMARWLGGKLPAALHVDTGMTRLGFLPGDLARMDAGDLARVEPVLLVSHLACGEDRGGPMNAEQLALITQASASLPGVPVSLANSPGAFLDGFELSLTRPGVALYGANPTPGEPNPMRPVVTLTASVVQVHELTEERPVGYGATYKAKAGSKIATLGIGYADGWPRSTSNNATALIQGVEAPLAGRVSMDLTALDVTALPEGQPQVGDEAALIHGPDGIDRAAEAAGTIPYEVLTRITARVERRYVG